MLKSAIDRTAQLSHWKRLGKIKLGLKKRSDKIRCKETHAHTDDCYYSYPVDVNYFVIPDEFKAKLGDKPQRLAIMLAFPTLEQNFDTRAAVYNANGVKWCHTTDDVTAQRQTRTTVPNPKKKYANDPDTIERTDYKAISCPALECEYRKNGKCKERGQFEFMVPGLWPEVGTLFLKIGSKVSSSQILGTLQALEYFCRGRKDGMQGVRLLLERVQTFFNVDLNGDGQLSKVEKWIPKVSIDFASLRADDQALLMPVVGQQLVVPTVATAEDLDTRDDTRDGHTIIDQEPNPV